MGIDREEIQQMIDEAIKAERKRLIDAIESIDQIDQAFVRGEGPCIHVQRVGPMTSRAIEEFKYQMAKMIRGA